MSGLSQSGGRADDDFLTPEHTEEERRAYLYRKALERIAAGDFPLATVTEDMQRIAKEALDG